jgi:penicillin-insensitive murein endopeptidase
MSRRLALLAAILLPGLATAASSPTGPWGAATTPSAGPTRVIGGPASGCLAGAAMLPPDGAGYEAIRLSRHRNYSHPATIDYVASLGRAAQGAGLPIFMVGDLSQPRGGPMAFGHGSHQNGVDVDIWFTFEGARARPVAAREEVDLPSMVLADKSGVDTQRFGAAQVTLLRLAAADQRVDRIFVNPVIKQALCEVHGGAERGWLHKIRPWYGHDDHFHIRLACPADSPLCQGQAPVPPGDGCDASLAWWLEPHPPAPTPPVTPPPPKPKLPAQCLALVK